MKRCPTPGIGMEMQIKWHFSHINLSKISNLDNINHSNNKEKQVLSADENIHWNSHFGSIKNGHPCEPAILFWYLPLRNVYTYS